MTAATKCSVVLLYLNICLTIGFTSRLYSEVEITVPVERKSYKAFYEGKYARYIHSIEAVNGVLVIAQDDFGCPFNKNTSVSLPGQPFVLLIRLTTCSDYDQSLLAQNLGARGVVFHSSSGQLTSIATWGDLSIAVTLVAIDNSVLADLYSLPLAAKPTVTISPLQRSTQASPHFYFIIISIVALAAIFGSWFVLTVVRRWWISARRSRLRVRYEVLKIPFRCSLCMKYPRHTYASHYKQHLISVQPRGMWRAVLLCKAIFRRSRHAGRERMSLKG